jgi:hypothetical protein
MMTPSTSSVAVNIGTTATSMRVRVARAIASVAGAA